MSEREEQLAKSRQTAFNILSRHPDCLRDDTVMNDLIKDIAEALHVPAQAPVVNCGIVTHSEAIARLSASEVACYRWAEDTTEHRAMRAAFCDGAAHTVSIGIAQGALPPLVDRSELVALLEDLASVNLSRGACERQARRMADDLIARGLTFSSTEPAQGAIGPRELKPITMSDIRLAAGEGKLSAHDVLAAANAVLRNRQRTLSPTPSTDAPAQRPVSLRKVEAAGGFNIVIDDKWAAFFPKESETQIDLLIEMVSIPSTEGK